MDVGFAICYNILKADVQVSCQTTVRYFTLDECADPEHNKMRDEFDTHVTYWMGGAVTTKYFDTSDLTPECIYYEDPYPTIHEGSPDEFLPTPESWDNYVNVEIIHPRGDEMAMGRVTKWARDLNGNPLGTADDNPILDTRQYIVEFSNGYEAELAANVIV